MTSRETSEYFMPSLPFAMPSEMVMVLKNNCLATVGIRAFLGFERKFVNVHVARRDIAPGRCDADDGLLEIFFRKTDGIKHGAGGGAFRSVHENTGKGAQGIFGFGLFHLRKCCH